MSRYRFIEAERASHPVALLARVLKVSRAAYYSWTEGRTSSREHADEALLARIRSIHQQSRGTYGSPRVSARLRAEGTSCSRKRVARLMREDGLVGRCPKRFRKTTVPDPMARAVDLVRRHFTATEVDRLWVADISYVRTWEGFTYLAVVLDACSRRVVGWAMADHLRTELATEALRMALSRRRPSPGLIHHSDRGCQYTSDAYGQLLAVHGAFQSVGRPGTCWDNALVESFFATLKTELVHRHVWPTRRHARQAIFEWIEGFYNRTRLHSALGYLSPAQFESTHARVPEAA